LFVMQRPRVRIKKTRKTRKTRKTKKEKKEKKKDKKDKKEGRRSPSKSPQPPSPKKPAERFKIYVGNLSMRTTSEYLGKLYEPFGAVSCKVMMEHARTDGAPAKSRGFAFVEFESEEAMNTAIEKSNGVAVHNSELKVNQAMSKDKKGGPATGTGQGGTGHRFDNRFNFEKTHAEMRAEKDDANISAYFKRKAAREAARA